MRPGHRLGAATLCGLLAWTILADVPLAGWLGWLFAICAATNLAYAVYQLTPLHRREP